MRVRLPVVPGSEAWCTEHGSYATAMDAPNGTLAPDGTPLQVFTCYATPTSHSWVVLDLPLQDPTP